MSTGISITLPWQPQPQVSPNSRGSSRNARDHHRANRDLAMMATRSHMARELEPWTCPDTPAIDLTVYWGKGRHLHDLDNLSAMAKGVIDGVTRELGFDDRRIVALTVAQGKDVDGIGYTVISIREATEWERRRIA